MAFKQGNKAGGRRKERLVYEAIMIELKNRDDERGLRRMASNLIDVALDKDHKDWLAATKEIANRLDGTPVATVDMNLNDNRTVEELPDSELTAIIRGTSSRSTVVDATDGTEGLDSVH
jgi:predicted methyltransferase MtxX (methanogen marker protein 4)